MNPIHRHIKRSYTPKETYKEIGDILTRIQSNAKASRNAENRQKITYSCPKQRISWLDYIGYSLPVWRQVYPSKAMLLVAIVLVIYVRYMVAIQPFLPMGVPKNIVNGFFISIYIYLTIYAVRPIINYKPSPTSDEIWNNVKLKWFEDTSAKCEIEVETEYMKKRILRAITFYKRESEFLSILIGLMWSGVLIGSLPDREFQIALSTFSINKMLEVNPLGAICTILLPFFSAYYYRNFGVKIYRLEALLNEIELGEE